MPLKSKSSITTLRSNEKNIAVNDLLTEAEIFIQTSMHNDDYKPEVINDIKHHLEPNNVIVTSTPLAGPVRYYMQKNNVDLTKLFWYYKNVNKSILNNFENIFIITREGRNSLESFGITDDVTLMDYKTPIIWKEYDNSVKVYHIQKS